MYVFIQRSYGLDPDDYFSWIDRARTFAKGFWICTTSFKTTVSGLRTMLARDLKPTSEGEPRYACAPIQRDVGHSLSSNRCVANLAIDLTRRFGRVVVLRGWKNKMTLILNWHRSGWNIQANYRGLGFDAAPVFKWVTWHVIRVTLRGFREGEFYPVLSILH